MINKDIFNEEYKIFETLCPDCIKDIINDRQISYPEYIKIIKMFEELGFMELAKWYKKSHYREKAEKTKALTHTIAGEDLKIFCGEDCNNINYIKLFVNNIKSKGLKELFYEKSIFYCLDDEPDK